MELRSTVLTAYFQDLKTEFNNALTAATPVWPALAMKITSNTETNIYGWMEELPQFREWKGMRVFHNIKSNGYSLTNKEFEWSVGVKATKIKDGQNDIYAPLSKQGGANAAYFPDIQVFNLLNDGFTDTCWDGKAFFAADHPWKPDGNGDPTTLNNLSTLVLNAENFETVLALFKQNLQGGDNPFFAGAPSITLVVGTALEAVAKRIVVAEKDAFGADNVNHKAADLMVNAQLDANKWYLILTNNAILPFIYQEREAVTMESNEGTVDIRETGQYKLMADMRCAFGYSLPALAYGSTGLGQG